MRGGKATLLFEMLKRTNAEITLIAPKIEGWEKFDAEGKNGKSTVKRIPKLFFNLPLPPIFRIYWFKVALLLSAAKNELKKEKYDALLCCQLLTEGAVGLYVKKEFRIPYVVYTYDTIDVEQPLNGKDSRIAKEILENAEKVVCISSFMKEKLIQIGIAEEKVVMVNPGVDTKRFVPKKPSEGIAAKTGFGKNKVVLTVARLVERKGIDYAIKAFAEVKKEAKDAKFVVVGEGPERNDLERLAGELGLKEDVIFAGAIGDDELVDYYNACDLFVLPSIVNDKEFQSEGFGIVFLEANACGKPVVGTRTAGIIDAVDDNRTGLLVEQKNTGQLAAAMKKILSDGKLAKKMGENGRKRAIDKFDWEVVAEKFEKNVLQKVDVKLK
jgi:phosphatidylinositol alpha-1,6-mannosyltransferase